MDLIGHLSVLCLAEVLTPDEAFGDAVIAGMFPNFFHCHEWGYDELLAAGPDCDDGTPRAVQGHLITDWVIHFGERWARSRQRIGFAYEVMDAASAEMGWFFAEAESRGLLVRPEALQAKSDERLHRDFAHTAVECAFERLVAERHFGDEHLPRLREAMRSALAPERMAALQSEVFADMAAWTKEPPTMLERSRGEYAAWLDIVDSLTDFPALLFDSKFGVVQSPDGVVLAEELFSRVRRATDAARFWRCFDECVAAVAEPAILYARVESA